jgi:hypothetical protein
MSHVIIDRNIYLSSGKFRDSYQPCIGADPCQQNIVISLQTESQQDTVLSEIGFPSIAAAI